MTHKTSYQTHQLLSHSANSLFEKKKIAEMKAEGTYCDRIHPDRSFTQFKSTTCKTCPNYEECERKSEEESQNILKYRQKSLKKSKTKRKHKGGK
jgi:hypothetical protein